jgi:hypothetical protein
MSIKLGDHTIVLVKSADQLDSDDGYGNPVRLKVYREVRWCLVAPTRASEDQSRTSPAITGAQLLAPPTDSGTGTLNDIEAADEILWPWTRRPDGTYTGRRWEILGEVGVWEEALDCQLRRLT